MDKIKSFFREENAAKIFESKEFVWVWLAIVFICWITGGWVAGCNLKTKRRDFGDGKLSFDFRLPELSNSGVWLKGRFEVNICDSYGWALDNRNSGVLCGLSEPLASAERPFGEWQHIDVWFVNRHCTIILNGVKTVCRSSA